MHADVYLVRSRSTSLCTGSLASLAISISFTFLLFVDLKHLGVIFGVMNRLAELGIARGSCFIVSLKRVESRGAAAVGAIEESSQGSIRGPKFNFPITSLTTTFQRRT
jgi:hypothetical protein